MSSNQFGGHQIFARKICYYNNISKKKKKKRSSPVSLHLFHHFRPKYVTKREAKQVTTFFFFWRCYCSDKFFGQNIKTLTQIARKIKNCPKFYKQGGPVPPRTPTSYAYGMHRWCAGYDWALIRFCSLTETSCSAYSIKSLCYL